MSAVETVSHSIPAALTETLPPPPPAARVGAPAPQRPTPKLARWAWLIVLAAGLALFEAVDHALRATHNPNLLPSLILLGAVVIPAAFVAFIYGLRLDYDVDTTTLILVAFVGGIIGVVTAGLVEYQTLQHLGALPAIAIAGAEETAKLLAPLAILLFTRHRRPADGLLIGVACGAGFAAMETMGYSAVALVQSHQNLLTVDRILLQRSLFSPATHMAWTGITAAALWHTADQRWRPARSPSSPPPSPPPSPSTPPGTALPPYAPPSSSPRSASDSSPSSATNSGQRRPASRETFRQAITDEVGMLASRGLRTSGRRRRLSPHRDRACPDANRPESEHPELNDQVRILPQRLRTDLASVGPRR